MEIFSNPSFLHATGSTIFVSQPIYNSNWQWLHPTPQGNNFRFLKVWDANNWYAMGYAGAFVRTSDAGATWFVNKSIGGVSATGTGYNLFGGYFLDLNTGLACGENGILIRTTDAGRTWNSVYSGATGFIYEIFFLDSNVGYACGVTSVGLLKTTNAGQTWTQLPGTLPTSAYSIYAFNQDTIILGSTTGNTLRTTDGGVNWTTIYAAGASLIWSMDFMNGNTGMAGGIDAALAYTTNAGASWTAANSGIPATSDFFDIEFRQNAFYATGDPFNMYNTTNLGTTWSSFSYNDPNQAWTAIFFESGFIDDNTFISVGTNGMINKNVIQPASSVAHNSWIKAGTLYDNWAESSTGRVIAVGTPGISGTTFDQAMYSTNGGETWAVAATLDSTEHDFNSLSMVSPLIGYATCEDHFVYKTTTGGQSWFQVTQPAVSTSDLENIFFVDANTGYTFGATGLGYKTTNGGTTWTPLTTGSSATLFGSFFLDANTGFVCGATGNLLKTTNGGTSFTPLNPNNTSTIYSVYMVNSNVGYAAGSSGRVRKTIDGGATWGTVDVGRTTTLYDIQFTEENNGIAVGSGGATFITANGGATWSFENAGSSTIYSVAIERTSTGNRSVFTCGSSGSIQKSTNAITVNVKGAEQLPVAFTLSQNYPNPFNPTTKIKYALPRESFVTLKVYNLVGQEVATLVNERQGPANYEATLDASSLASGVYFYRLEAVDFVQTKKLIILR